MSIICQLFCKPGAFTAEGADHTGVDLYLKCRDCGRRGDHHIECERPTPALVKDLRREWRRGAFA